MNDVPWWWIFIVMISSTCPFSHSWSLILTPTAVSLISILSPSTINTLNIQSALKLMIISSAIGLYSPLTFSTAFKLISILSQYLSAPLLQLPSSLILLIFLCSKIPYPCESLLIVISLSLCYAISLGIAQSPSCPANQIMNLIFMNCSLFICMKAYYLWNLFENFEILFITDLLTFNA